MFLELEGQKKTLIKDTVELTYFMRGAIQYNDALELTAMEREIHTTFLNKHLDKEVKKINPNY